MVMWCTIKVMIECFGPSPAPVCISETAAKGKVIHETGSSYVLDFSEYAKKQKYSGDYSEVTVDRDKCIKDEK